MPARPDGARVRRGRALLALASGIASGTLLLPRFATAQHAPAWNADARIERFTLPNGLRVTLDADSSASMAATNLWYRVGSANEMPGRTGLAHLLEHLMFAGTPNAQRGAFDEWLEDAGARSNASTTHDRTSYFAWMPSNVLPLALWLEADRMQALVGTIDSATFHRQLDIVRNERRETVDDAIDGRGYELVVGALFPGEHPYAWHPVGRGADLDSLTLDDVRDFARRHYVPANAELVVTGRFDRDTVRTLVQQYFGAIAGAVPGTPAAPRALPDARLTRSVSTAVPDDPAAPALFMAWHTVPTFTDDDAALDIVARLLAHDEQGRLDVLTGATPRLAQAASVAHYSARQVGFLVVSIFLAPDATPDAARQRVEREIERLAQDGPTALELTEARGAMYVQLLDRRADVMQRAELLNYYSFYAGAPAFAESDQARYAGVSAADVQRVVRRYLMAPHARVSIGSVSVTRSHAIPAKP